jgi:hypothetical protein
MNALCWRPIEMSRCAPDRNVSVNRVEAARWKCVESPFCGDFQGLWEGWNSFIVPRFPSDRHFHRC